MPLYIGTPSVFVHTEYTEYHSNNIFSFWSYSWSSFVLVLSSTVLGESCPKVDSYMVLELLENSSSQAVQDQHLASSPQPDSGISQKLGVSNIRSDLTIASGMLIRWKSAIQMPTLGQSRLWGIFFANRHPKDRFAILVWSFQICIFNFQIYIFFICISAIFSDLHYFFEFFWPLGHRRDFCKWRLVLAGANQTFASHLEGQKTPISDFVSSKLVIWRKI